MGIDLNPPRHRRRSSAASMEPGQRHARSAATWGADLRDGCPCRTLGLAGATARYDASCPVLICCEPLADMRNSIG